MLSSELRRVLRQYKMEGLPFPLYYCLPNGVRFEGGEDAAARAGEVFSAAFPKNHELLVLFDIPPAGKVEKAFAAFEREVEPTEHFDTGTGDLWVSDRYFYRLPAHKLPLTVLFDAIVKEEDYAGRVWLVDLAEGTLMMLYGAAGFDITSPRPALPARLFREFKAYLSLIDLPEMKQKYAE